MNWGLEDYVAAAVLLTATAGAILFARKRLRSPRAWIVATLAIFAVLVLVWAELAVGLFD